MLETGSQALLSAILSQASDSMGGRMTVSLDSLPGSAGPQQVSLGLPPDKALTLSALQRHKRQFVRLHSAGKHAGSDVGRLGDTDTELDVARRFAHYLETSL